MSWWRKQLGGGPAGSVAERFVPAVVVGHARGVIIRLPGGIEVEAPELGLVPASWVAAVVGALGHAG